MAATGDAVVELDGAPGALGEGPCLDAASFAAVVYVSDLSEDARYPAFRTVATAADIRTVLACPISSEGIRGALNLYAQLPNAFGATDPPRRRPSWPRSPVPRSVPPHGVPTFNRRTSTCRPRSCHAK